MPRDLEEAADLVSRDDRPDRPGGDAGTEGKALKPDAPATDPAGANADGGEGQGARKQGGGARRLILGLAAVALVAGGTWLGREWWTVGRFTESTEDAYVKADIATYSAQVAGRVTAIEVADNAAVKAGDALLRIDPTRYRAALQEAEAGVASAKAAIETTDAQIDLQSSNVTAAEADVAAAKAQLAVAKTDAERSQQLLARGATTQAATDQYTLAFDKAQAGLRAAEAALQVAQGQVPVLITQRHQQEAALRRAEAAQVLAQQDLDDTVIRAKRDGVVGNRGVDLGEFVGAGTKLISLVPLDEIYVVANFKETQVRDFRPGMEVEVTADMLGGAHFSGEIDSIAPATGSEFALLPTENATGNFTKIVQRIPVRIRIDPPATDGAPRLRPGTSVLVDVNTGGARG